MRVDTRAAVISMISCMYTSGPKAQINAPLPPHLTPLLFFAQGSRPRAWGQLLQVRARKVQYIYTVQGENCRSFNNLNNRRINFLCLVYSLQSSPTDSYGQI